MIVSVRLFDGTIFDFDTKYIVYNTTQPVEYGEKTVYPSVLSPNFVIDYNVPKYFERSESEHDLVDRVTCVARHSLGLQLSCSPITVELLTPEKAYEQIDNLEKIFMHKFYIDYFSYSFNSRFIKLISSKRWAVCYIMSVYGVCAEEAFKTIRDRDLILDNLNFGKDEEMNRIHFKHFDQNIRDIMTKKNIQFPQTVTTTIGGF